MTLLPQRFVDTHVHFWDHAIDGVSWPFLDPGFEHPRLNGLHRLDAPHYTGEELRIEAGDAAPHRVVHVQCAQEAEPGLETAWLQKRAEETGWPHAVVARCRLAADDAAEVLARHTVHPLFRGIRDTHAPRDLERSEFLDGWSVLADSGGSLEVMVPHQQFRGVLSTARHRPDGTVVLGHAGLPVQRDDAYFREWSAAMTDLAREPNVVCKISALASGADPEWSPESIRPWVRTCIDAFGPSRCMFASNWPIDRLFGSYTALLDAYDQITEDLTGEDRAELFAGTAERIYGL